MLEFSENIKMGYADINDVIIQEQINHIVPKSIEPKKIQDIKMRDTGACIIDGYNTQVWDTNTGHCVFYYIIHKYGKVKGFIGTCKNCDKLNDFFKYLNHGTNRKKIIFLRVSVQES